MSKVAFLFPGQGSQAVGMGKDFFATPLGETLADEALDALGFDLKHLCLEGPADQLTLTQFAQPAILAVSTLAFREFQARFPRLSPAFVAGHSLGEYSALVASGVLGFGAAVKAVHLRGQYMQAAVPVGIGGMAAVMGMQAPELEAICSQASTEAEQVKPANYNCPGQIVISGHLAAVNRVLEQAKGKLLEVSAPFHSSLMQPAAEQLQRHLQTLQFHQARWPVINNVANQALTQAGDFLPSLVAQVASPVRWDTGIQTMIAQGVTHFIEFGHGRVLAGMMKRIDKTAQVINLQTPEDLDQNAAALAALG